MLQISLLLLTEPQKKQNVSWASTDFLLPASVKTMSILTELEKLTIGEKKRRNEFSWAAFKQQLYCGKGNAKL